METAFYAFVACLSQMLNRTVTMRRRGTAFRGIWGLRVWRQFRSRISMQDRLTVRFAGEFSLKFEVVVHAPFGLRFVDMPGQD